MGYYYETTSNLSLEAGQGAAQRLQELLFGDGPPSPEPWAEGPVASWGVRRLLGDTSGKWGLKMESSRQ